MNIFISNDFSKTRPHREKSEPSYNFLLNAQEEGANIIQDFHESMTVRGGKFYSILAYTCAFANTNGGSLYIGLTADQKKVPVGVTSPEKNIAAIEKGISNRISPPLQCQFDVHEIKGKNINPIFLNQMRLFCIICTMLDLVNSENF